MITVAPVSYTHLDVYKRQVTDRSWLNGRTLYSQVEEAIKGGATFIQLREKELNEDAFLEEAKEIKELCARYHVPFVINDNVEIALAMDADGVHAVSYTHLASIEKAGFATFISLTRSLIALVGCMMLLIAVLGGEGIWWSPLMLSLIHIY